MTWREIEKVMKNHYDVSVLILRERNAYILRSQGLEYKITSQQFDKLLEEGWIDPDYRIERNTVTERHIYEGR